MAKSKKNVRIEEKPEAPVSDVGIVSILETNYMPYAMSVIVSRAIPEICLLYTSSLIALKSILSGSLTYAIEPLGFIQTNPASMVKLPSKRATPETPTRKKVREVVPSERWNQIIARFPYGHPCHCLLYTSRCV